MPKPKDFSDRHLAPADPAVEAASLARRKRVPFASTLDAGLYEKMRAAAYWDETNIADILESAVRAEILRREAERGQPYKVEGPHRIKS